MEEPQQIEEVESKIKELENTKMNLKNQEKRKKIYEDKKLRLRTNNKGKSNIIRRMSINFKNRIDKINKKREENGFEALSYPKITELIIRHKTSWKKIEEDLIHYNTVLDEGENPEDFKNE